jgi:hypothetical protein
VDIHLTDVSEQTQCSETSVIKHHTPENNPKDYTQHLERGESLKSRILKPFARSKALGIYKRPLPA